MDEEEFEELFENVRILGGARYRDDDEGSWPVTAVFKCLKQLPNDVREWVKDNVVFFSSEGANSVAQSIRINLFREDFSPRKNDPNQDARVIRIIYLDNAMFKFSDSIRQAIIAHEIGHCYLGHADIDAVGAEEFDRREAEAEQLAIDWGFGDALRDHHASGRTVRKASDFNRETAE